MQSQSSLFLNETLLQMSLILSPLILILNYKFNTSLKRRGKGEEDQDQEKEEVKEGKDFLDTMFNEQIHKPSISTRNI